jgi:branched-chain amino acid transport system substrate-binding protein
MKKALCFFLFGTFFLGIISIAPALAKEEVIKIGVVGALTGDFASNGHSQLTGAQMKAKELNDAGGNYKIELISEDDASNCDQSVNATTKLITRNSVEAVIGAINSPCALAMVPITQRYETPQFTFGVGTAITQKGSKWIFRVAVGAPGQAKDLVNYAVKKAGHTKFAIMYADDEYGASMATGFKQALADLKLEPVAYESYPRSDKDFTGQLTKIKNSGATAFFPTGSYTASALIAKQAQQLGLKLQLLGDTGNASPKYMELGGDAVEGTVIVEPFTVADPDPKVQSFCDKYRKMFNREPDGWVAEIYDTVGMIHAAVTKAGKIDRKVIRDYAASLKPGATYKGILGDWYFDSVGNATFPLYKVQIKGGKKVILER